MSCFGCLKQETEVEAHPYSPTSLAKEDQNQTTKDDLLKVLAAIKRVNNQQSLATLVSSLIEETCSVLNCEKATLFVVEKEKRVLVIMSAMDKEVKNVEIPFGKGIAGAVHSTGEDVKIDDVYQDSRFDQAMDKKTGFKTTSLMCVPVRDMAGETCAVFQVINKRTDEGKVIAFQQKDVELLDALRDHCGVILRNVQLHEKTMLEKERVSNEKKRVYAMMDMLKSMQSDLGLPSLMFTITNRGQQITNAELCTLFMHEGKELFTLNGAKEIKIPDDAGMAGAVVTTGNIVNVKDVYEDSRFNKDSATEKQMRDGGKRTKSMLVCPIKTDPSSKEVLGVLQLINKQDILGDGEDSFTEQDEEIIMYFLSQLAPHLEANLASRTKKVETEVEKMQSRGSQRNKKAPAPAMAITEEEEEEEEEG
mmetsp:Transcript_27603/g.33505  ORF Transcript_27603/g.33505 Transcript_27603/m.33505 type:complete len:421 (-) Transcript_27603:272-1534(-)|eukprot:CAMPEP_0197846240 /NCGR_PEP_ID=MMETSP1438-20131217/3019_1 /TAXON_ID=1461541 /ORGANISM="Pterosperma sp., Strain CCMP1384" /LENGTH=420 /DNA_ID=CAMNT_0043457817 /DNA_START=223 /DNA_END=1485 /DNA_ORIENTATION=+